jgi:DNA-directed RNA polymerase subunit RPC12/RpoP
MKKPYCPHCGHNKSENWRRVWGNGRKPETFYKCKACRRTFDPPNTRHIPPAATAGKDGQQSKDNEVSDA